MFRLSRVCSFGLLLLVGCLASKQQPAAKVVRVAAAANLTFAFPLLEAEFEKRHPDIDLQTTFGSSGHFFNQLKQQAPYDIFFSADTKYPAQLAELKRTTTSTPVVYARGCLVIWSSRFNSEELAELGMSVVQSDQVRKIAIANPRLAPYGAAAVAALQHAGLFAAVEEQLVYGENVGQVAHFVQSGAADLGFIALAQSQAESLKSGGCWEVPPELYPPIDQAAAVLLHSQQQEAASQLLDFVLSSRGQRLLEKSGYAPLALKKE